jgi:hypothetical protein
MKNANTQLNYAHSEEDNKVVMHRTISFRERNDNKINSFI